MCSVLLALSYLVRSSIIQTMLECVTGYQVIRVIRIFAKPIRSNSNLALLGKIDQLILSIRNNRFMFLHSEVLRYSRPFSYLMRMYVSALHNVLLHG